MTLLLILLFIPLIYYVVKGAAEDGIQKALKEYNLLDNVNNKDGSKDK